VQADYYPRVVGTEFGLLLGSTSVTYYSTGALAALVNKIRRCQGVVAPVADTDAVTTT
jgi:hypothetical protein